MTTLSCGARPTGSSAYSSRTLFWATPLGARAMHAPVSRRETAQEITLNATLVAEVELKRREVQEEGDEAHQPIRRHREGEAALSGLGQRSAGSRGGPGPGVNERGHPRLFVAR